MHYQIGILELFGMLIGTVALICIILNSRNLLYSKMIAFAALVRVMMLLCDMLHLFPIPNLGADSEFFHYLAEANQYSKEPRYVTNYTVFLTYFYSLTDCSRVMAQFTNVLFGMGVIVYGQKCLRLFNIESHYVRIGTMILCFEPNLIIFSAGLLREAWVEFFTAASLYSFLKWYKTGGNTNFGISLAFLLGGTYMHGGTIGIAVGYFLTYTLYNRKKDMYMLNTRSWFAIILICVFSAFLMNNMNLFGNKFEGIDDDNANEVLISSYEKTEVGGSDYLQWLPVSSTLGAIAFSPLKMLYFLFSPVPWEWRGFKDLFAFFLDSIWYVILCWGIYHSKANHLKSIKQGLVISIVGVVFIFGLGVSNAGTAMRHRAKILPLLVVTYCISKSSRHETQ